MTVVPVLVFDEMFATLQRASSNQHPLSHDWCRFMRQILETSSGGVDVFVSKGYRVDIRE